MNKIEFIQLKYFFKSTEYSQQNNFVKLTFFSGCDISTPHCLVYTEKLKFEIFAKLRFNLGKEVP